MFFFSGLVKLNYSGPWTVKDVWETGGWEPHVDQLSWQRYEIAAAVTAALNDKEKPAAGEEEPPTGEVNNSTKDNESQNSVPVPTVQVKPVPISPTKLPQDGSSERTRSISGSPTSTSAAITRKLTSHVVGRQPPIITDPELQRDFLLRLSKLPWTEQRKIKESFDSVFNVKKVRKADKQMDNSSRHSCMPTRLDLKQVGKSIKSAKGKKGNPHKTKDESSKFEIIRGTLSGEWETEHSFVCSVCGIEYDDVLEIMHHKWEAHPHCLVTHVSLRQNVHRPPALLYPQVTAHTSSLITQMEG